MTIDEIRQYYPQWNDIPDAELVARIRQQYYPNHSYDVLAERLGVTVHPVDRGFFSKLGESISRGKANVLADVGVYEAVFKGVGDPGEAIRIWHDAQLKEQVDPIDGNLLTEMIYGGARLIGQFGPQIKAGGKSAIVLSVAGAGVGAAAGLLAGGPSGEEALTTGAGARLGLKLGTKFGLASGSALFSFKQGAGQMYATMKAKGVDEEVAKLYAQVGAIPYALVEAYQLKGAGSAVAGLGLRKALAATSGSLAMRIGKQYAKEVGKQILEEDLQEVVQIATEDAAAWASDLDLQLDPKYVRQRFDRIMATTIEAAKSFALVPVPGVALNLSTELALRQNLVEEDAEAAMMHEGHRPGISQEDFNALPENIRKAAQAVMHDMDISVDEALKVVEGTQTNSLEAAQYNPDIVADNVEDAVAAVQPVKFKNEVVGLEDSKTLNKIWNKTKEVGANYTWRHIRIRNLLRSLEGVANGVLRKVILNPLRVATTQGSLARTLAVKEIQRVVGELGLKAKDLFSKTINITKTGQTLTGEEAIEVYLAQFDEDKMRHLKEGNKFDDEMIQEVIGQMTEAQTQLGSWLLEKYRTGYDDINAVYQVVNDGKILPRIIGYSRIFINEKPWNRDVDFTSSIIKEMDRRGLHKRGVKEGFTKERTRSIAPLRMQSLTNYFDHAMQTEWYKAVAIPAHKVGMIVSDKNFQKKVNDRTGGVGSKILSKWVQDIASERTSLETTWFGHVLNVLRQNSVVAALGFNVLTMLKQPVSLMMGIADDISILPYVTGNFAEAAKGPSGLVDFMYSKSDNMKARSFERDIRQKARSRKAKHLLHISKMPALSEAALYGIQFMDKLTVSVLWKSKYEQAIARGVTEAEAISIADGLIEKTQPMADIIDLPDFFRGGPIEKMFSTFQNQINQNVNYWAYDIIGARKKGEISNSQVASRVLGTMLLPALMMGMISRGRAPEEPKEIVQDIAQYAVSPAFFFGSITGGLIQGYGIHMPVGFGAFEEVHKGIKTPSSLPKRLAGAAATAGGMPWTQIRRSGEGILALTKDETDDLRRIIWSGYGLESKSEASPATSFSKGRRGRSKRTGRRSRR